MVTLEYAFFCEDVRNEEGGRITAVGMPGGDLRLKGAPPGNLRSLSFVAHFANPDRETTQVRITINGPGLPQDVVVFENDLKTKTDETGHFVNLIMGPLTIPTAGDFVARVEVPGEHPIDRRIVLQVSFRE